MQSHPTHGRRNYSAAWRWRESIGSFGSLLHRLGQVDVLVVNDFAMAPLADQERRDFLEICEERYDLRSTILTSQVPVTKWHAQVGCNQPGFSPF